MGIPEWIGLRMTKIGRIILIIVVIVAIITVIPLFIDLSPVGTVTNAVELADPDSLFVEIDDLTVHYKMAGSGETVLIMLHGFGSNVYSWEKVLNPLSSDGTVIAYDWVGFGLTSRPLSGSWSGENPYSTTGQVKLLIKLMDHLGIEKAVLVGNSAGALIAGETAITHPERVIGLILVDPALNGTQFSPFVSWLIKTPQMDGIGPFLSRQIVVRGDDFIKSAWHDPSLITDETYNGYRKPLEMVGWDYGLWEFTKADKENVLEKVDKLDLPVLVMTGSDDRIIPTKYSIELSGLIPGAELVVIDNAGHVPQEEKPEEFIRIVNDFIARLPN